MGVVYTLFKLKTSGLVLKVTNDIERWMDKNLLHNTETLYGLSLKQIGNGCYRIIQDKG